MDTPRETVVLWGQALRKACKTGLCAVRRGVSAGETPAFPANGGTDWENFFLGGDTNAPVSAQIRLWPSGDFATRSNEVETVCRRVNPDDWDGDGIANEIDASPYENDGDFFGVANPIPDGANSDAYYWESFMQYAIGNLA